MIPTGTANGADANPNMKHNSQTPLVSIGLPIYNGDGFLRACLDSLLAQTYTNYEIILCDNASTDETVTICESYAARDSRIKLLRGDRNLGSAWNHNRAREAATGQFFKWCGADDVIAPRFLEATVDALVRNPDAVLAYPASIVIDEENNETARTATQLPLDSHDPIVRFRAVLRALQFTQNVFYGLIRADRLGQARPMGSFLANDRCLVAELALMGRFIHVDEFLMYRRKHRARTRIEEQRLYVPNDVRSFRPREWVVFRENLTSIARASLPGRIKRRLVAALVSWAFAQRMTLIDEGKEVAAQSARNLRRFFPSSTSSRDIAIFY